MLAIMSKTSLNEPEGRFLVCNWLSKGYVANYTLRALPYFNTKPTAVKVISKGQHALKLYVV